MEYVVIRTKTAFGLQAALCLFRDNQLSPVLFVIPKTTVKFEVGKNGVCLRSNRMPKRFTFVDDFPDRISLNAVNNQMPAMAKGTDYERYTVSEACKLLGQKDEDWEKIFQKKMT